jgi:hypothetical protein
MVYFEDEGHCLQWFREDLASSMGSYSSVNWIMLRDGTLVRDCWDCANGKLERTR